jgi:hypothetical protein
MQNVTLFAQRCQSQKLNIFLDRDQIVGFTSPLELTGASAFNKIAGNFDDA